MRSMEQQGSAAPPRPAKPAQGAQGGPPARVHRAPGRPPPAPLPAPSPAPATPVSLERPRPPTERRLNTYVEAPPRATRPPEPEKRGIVTSQPAPAPAKRTEGPPCSRPPESIICTRCGRCRCAQCARPRALPSRWVGSFLCSAEATIDYMSCMCCVKALFYHCCNEGDGDGDSGGEACADEPCSCSGARRCSRWSCLTALSVVLPCLLCYLPLRGAAALCAGAYARTRPAGCRCRPRAPDKLPLAPGPHY